MNRTKSDQVLEIPDEYIYGIKGLAQEFGTSIGTAARIKNQVPYYQCGRTIRFKKSEVLKALSKNNQTA